MLNWDKYFETGKSFKPFNHIFAKQLIEKHKLSGRFLDLGCGVGADTRLFAPHMSVSLGLDGSEAAISRALTEAVPTTSFITWNLENPFPGYFFDTILCKYVLAFIQDKRAFLEGVHNSMSNNATLLLVTPVSHAGITYVAEDKPEIMVPQEELLHLIRGLFIIVEEHHTYNGERNDECTLVLKAYDTEKDNPEVFH